MAKVTARKVALDALLEVEKNEWLLESGSQ